MFGINPGEFAVLLVIALIVVGPERLPKYAAQLGRMVREGRKMAMGLREQVRGELGPEFDDVDWKKLDPRQYDPRKIIRDALTDTLEDDEPPARPAPKPVSSGGPAAVGGAAAAAGAVGAAAATTPSGETTTTSPTSAPATAPGSSTLPPGAGLPSVSPAAKRPASAASPAEVAAAGRPTEPAAADASDTRGDAASGDESEAAAVPMARSSSGAPVPVRDWCRSAHGGASTTGGRVLAVRLRALRSRCR